MGCGHDVISGVLGVGSTHERKTKEIYHEPSLGCGHSGCRKWVTSLVVCSDGRISDSQN